MAKQQVLLGQTDYTVLVLIRDDAGAPKTALTEASIDIAYARVETDNDVTTSDVTPAALTALTDAHTDWGFEEVSATDHPGVYRLDIADAVFASGAWSAVVTIVGTGLDPTSIEFELVNFDPKATTLPSGSVTAAAIATGAIDADAIADGAIDAGAFAADAITAAKLASDVTTELQSGLATAAELAKVPKSDSNVTWNATAAAQIQSEATDALNAYDPPTQAEAASYRDTITAFLRGLTTTAGTVGDTGNDTTHVHLNGLTYGNDEINGYMLVIYDISELEYHHREITDWVLATELATVDTLPFTPTDTDSFWLLQTLGSASLTGGDATEAKQDTIIATLGALNDAAADGAVTTTDTIVAYLKQLINTLEGAPGIPTWPAAAAPGNAVSIAEAVRYIYDQIGVAGAGLTAADDAVMTRLGAPAGASVSADIADIEGKVDDLESRLGTPSDFGSGTSTIAANLQDMADNGTATFDRSTDSLQAIRDHVGDGTNLTEAGGTGDHLTAIDLPNQTMNITGNITGNLSGSVGSVTGAVGSVTGNVGGNVTGSVGSLAAQAKADVNAEVVDALNTDTYAEPGQGNPAATASLVAKIGYLYKAWRNRSTVTASEYALYADDATTKDQEAVLSDNGTTAEKGEVSTGA